MRLICESYNALCSLMNFEVNGIKAEEKDFGEHHDIQPELADDYACYNMKFIPKPATQEVLNKYNINVDEYNEVCNKLDEQLSFGNCGWCQ